MTKIITRVNSFPNFCMISVVIVVSSWLNTYNNVSALGYTERR